MELMVQYVNTYDKQSTNYMELKMDLFLNIIIYLIII